MSSNALLELAIRTAVQAHEGQLDKANLPYILHPLSVMYRVRELVGPKPEYLTVAVLHDVIEDCPGWTVSILEQDFPPSVMAGIDSVTKRPKEPWPDFVRRSKANEIGKIVKLADVTDNMSRLPKKYEARWVQKLSLKYQMALAILKDDHEWLNINRDLVIALESM